MKTSELTGAALDWAVAKCEGMNYWSPVPNYSTDWQQGGPIIEREKVSLLYLHDKWGAGVNAWTNQYGPTPLIAAMRCYVVSKLGDDVEIPKELQ